ncbi:hypothetical protein Hrd1104_09750 [Halorhabdus sp. CBA1104]|uniref:DUF5791 family protein n=1 Tax=Halorhabdus sp. CBA1104 TaxID=1380432 RepID=UPI0012B32A64|nr:DUF5791 family protein [Halorhabdus sp. CBA1104]QGN07562.1 hypothetical protein Hrd1104_09750 [Halorhabdus sp. CBA1104]
MFDDIDPGEHDAVSLRQAFETALQTTVETAGVETVRDQTALDRETIAAIAAGEGLDLTVADAAAIRALEDSRDAHAIAADARDRLLLAMSSAVLDVDGLAGALDADVTAKELQQKIEGRHPMGLGEYADVLAAVTEER